MLLARRVPTPRTRKRSWRLSASTLFFVECRGSIDEREMAERLREVAELLMCVRLAEQCEENGCRAQARQCEPIDRPVAGDQCKRAAIPDCSVVADRRIAR